MSGILLAITLVSRSVHAEAVRIDYTLTGASLSAEGDALGHRLTGGSFSVTHCRNASEKGFLNAFSFAFTYNDASYGTWHTTLRQNLQGSPEVRTLGGSAFSNKAAFSFKGLHTNHCIQPASYCVYTGYTPSVAVALPLSFKPYANGGLQFDPPSGTLSGIYYSRTVSSVTYVGSASINFIGQEVGRQLLSTELCPEPVALAQAVTMVLTVSVLSRRRAHRRAT